MNLEPKNILIINFGQLGDVVLSLPALRAVREKFPAAKITLAVGKSCATVIDLAGVANEKIVVDRVALRDGAKFASILQIGKLLFDVRRRDFDLVIDLHSLPETNILAFLSGAGKKLLSNRESRSLDFLGSFGLRPPREDKAKHATDRYLDALKPLKIENAARVPKISPRAADLEKVEKFWRKQKAENDLIVGLFPGAGHPSRRWSLTNFAELADFLARNEKMRIAVFLGPEEKDLAAEIRRAFPEKTIIVDKLNLAELVAALTRLSLFVSNDTGPMHLAAAVGASVVLLMDENAPVTYAPLIPNLKIVRSGKIDQITVDEALQAAQELLRAARSARIFDS